MRKEKTTYSPRKRNRIEILTQLKEIRWEIIKQDWPKPKSQSINLSVPFTAETQQSTNLPKTVGFDQNRTTEPSPQIQYYYNVVKKVQVGPNVLATRFHTEGTGAGQLEDFQVD